MCRAAFLDRDGVINRRPAAEDEYIVRWEDMHFLPDVAAAIRMLNAADYRVIVVTNQRCIAKRLASAEDVEEIHRRMCDTLATEGARIDAVYYCPHELEPPCECRKPAPGMLLTAARAFNIDLSASWMIGDADVDIQAGRNVGCKTAKVLSTSKPSTASADVVALSLAGAVRQILAEEGGGKSSAAVSPRI